MLEMRRLLVSVLAASFLIGTIGSPILAQEGPGRPVVPVPAGTLQLYEAVLDFEQWIDIGARGLDVAHVEETVDGVRVQVVLHPRQRAELRREGIDLQPVRNEDGLTSTQAAAQQSDHGFEVWRSNDEPGGIEDQIRAIADDPQNRGFVSLHKLGESHQGRDILALRLTQGARRAPLGQRPAVLYQATAHAREWISTEVNMRLLRWYVDQQRARDPEVTRLLRDAELWFVPMVNPDGYQYTFDGDRLWRKNLRDNDGDGQITNNDGVDLNRNLPLRWNYDEEGSSSQFASATYRGPAPASEPETQANMAVFDLADIRFAVSYHSYGDLLLYPQGWQVQTPSADDPVYVALSGTDDDPAVEGYDPGPSADLYTTNGEFTDWAHGARGALSWTPELSQGCPGCGFVFPDDEELVQAEFERNLDFARNVARSVREPDDPVSHMEGFELDDLYLDVSEIDPWKTNHPSADLRIEVSYAGGSSQPVEVLARRSVGDVTLHYSIDGRTTRTQATAPSPDGEVYGGNNSHAVHYHYVRGGIPDLDIGDEVTYWFTADGSASEQQSFTVDGDGTADVLVVAHEDRTGSVNIPGYVSTDPNDPNHLSFYTDALEANGVDHEVWDVDARDREAPDHLGVLGHYDAIVWYMGNNFVTRQAGRGPGNVDRLANDLVLEVRAYLNEGGSLLYTGQWAGAVENGFAGGQYYDPVADQVCVEGGALVLDRCQLFADKDDFLQYYLGAYLYNSDGGTDPAGDPYPVRGVQPPFSGLAWDLDGADSAQNQLHTASLLTTSSLLPPDEYPQFRSHTPAVWETGTGGGAFDPLTGEWYVYSGMADISYKRLTRTIDLTGVTASDAPTLTFHASYDIEPDWDFLFVEAHTVGQDDWTTLPEAGGRTDTATGASCAQGWFELHPWLERYQGAGCSGADPNTGGEWHATSGRSDGWERWEVDLSGYAGSEVEVAISYASDWAVQGLGVWVDDVKVSTESGVESFEESLGVWSVPGPPEGSAPNANDWERTTSVGYEEGAATATDNSLFFGFGFEGISDAGIRATVMDRSLTYLLDP
jgi:hypothetical protein